METAALWPALALIAGSAGGTFVAVPSTLCAAVLAIAWGAAVIAWWRERRALFVLALALAFATGGALSASHAAASLHGPGVLRHVSDETVVLEGRLREDAVPTDAGAAITLDVEGVYTGSALAAASGGVRLSVGGAFVGAAAPAWRAGRKVRVTATLRRPLPYRNFGLPDQEHRLALRGIRLVGSVKSAALVHVISPGTVWHEASASARAWSRDAIDRAIGRRDAEAGAIVTAVLIGDRSGLSREVERRLQRAGTFHIVAISGGNVAMLAGLVVWSVARTGLSPRFRAVLALVALGAYAGTVMGGASVGRATLAAAIYFAARSIDLRTPARNVIAMTMAVLLALDPVLVADTGFWLTFVASLAIVEQVAWASTGIQHGWLVVGGWPLPRLIRGIVTLFAATLVAEAGLIPISAHAFSQLTVAGLALNFAAVPLMALAQGAGIATIAAAAVHPAVSEMPGLVAGWCARAILESARLVDLVPWTVVRVPPPPLWLMIVSGVGWALAWFAPARPLRLLGAAWWTVSLMVLGAGPVLPGLPTAVLRHPQCPEPKTMPGAVRMTLLDVGQGAAALLRLPDGSSILVDAGGAAYGSRFDVGARIVSPALWSLSVRRLSTLVLTHGDGDHVGGAPAIVQDFAPAEIWEGVPVEGLPAMKAVQVAGERADVRWNRVVRGDRQDFAAATLRVWHPPAPDWERKRVRNDDSIVLELRVGRISIVMPGDIGSAVERDLAAMMPPAPFRILLAAHHGSRGSTSPVWLNALDPRLVLVTAGRDNPHGHPAPAMLDRVRAHGATLYRTDLDGAIEVDTDGREVVVTTCSGRTAAFSISPTSAARRDRLKD